MLCPSLLSAKRGQRLEERTAEGRTGRRRVSLRFRRQVLEQDLRNCLAASDEIRHRTRETASVASSVATGGLPTPASRGIRKGLAALRPTTLDS
jgi:hypothetical protein